MIRGDGPLRQALVEQLFETPRPYLVYDACTRALFQPAESAEAYLAAALSGERRRKIRNQERQLAKAGRLAYEELAPGDDVARRIAEFLALEASGWKGREASALASAPAECAYFEAIAGEAFRRGQLRMLALRLDGEPIACKCDFVSGHGAFTFKIAFDERHARHSPGLLLELQAIERLHAQSRIRWVDSCTHPTNFMFNRIWPARRTIESLVVATGRSPGDFLVSLLPLLAWLRRKLRRRAAGGRSDA
jgi:hypothetical protein